MAICPECGSTVDDSQEFCRECGTELTEVGGREALDDGVRVHLRDKERPLTVNRVRYHQGGGEWVTVTLQDKTVRIYPREDIEFIEGASVGVMGQGIRPVASKHEVKQVQAFSKAAQILGGLTS